MRLLTKLVGISLLCLTFAFAGTNAPVVTYPQREHAATHRIEQRTIFSSSVCSATAIGPHALLTAAHCVLASPQLLVDKDTFVTIQAQLVDDRDHIVLLIDGPAMTYVDVKVRPFVAGDEVHIFGNPGGFTDLYRRGVVSGSKEMGTPIGDAVTVVYLDLNDFFGDSGAAVFNADGQVMGVVSTLHVDQSFKLTGIVPLSFTADQFKEAREFKP